jgi:D-glucosaminate-6-phosphate ammonia-lyase
MPTNGESYPLLEITILDKLGRSAFEVARRLRHGHPPVYVGHSQLPAGKLLIHPLHLNDLRCQILTRRLQEELGAI